MLNSFDGNWAKSPDARKIGKRMIDLCQKVPRSHHCFWLGIADITHQRMHRAFILSLPVMDVARGSIIGVEMRIVHKASIELRPCQLRGDIATEDLGIVAQWMV